MINDVSELSAFPLGEEWAIIKKCVADISDVLDKHNVSPATAPKVAGALVCYMSRACKVDTLDMLGNVSMYVGFFSALLDEVKDQKV